MILERRQDEGIALYLERNVTQSPPIQFGKL
jgi:hypothetical protein